MTWYFPLLFPEKESSRPSTNAACLCLLKSLTMPVLRMAGKSKQPQAPKEAGVTALESRVDAPSPPRRSKLLDVPPPRPEAAARRAARKSRSMSGSPVEAKRQRMEDDRPRASHGEGGHPNGRRGKDASPLAIRDEGRHINGRRAEDVSPQGPKHERRRRRDSHEGGDRRRGDGRRGGARGGGGEGEGGDARQGGSARPLGEALKGSAQASNDVAPVAENDRWDMTG